MKKKRLYTCKEQNRFTGVGLLAFFLVIKDGLYSENPGYYIRKNQQCRVYRYEGKYYPESIYYEPKKDRTYIFDLCE